MGKTYIIGVDIGGTTFSSSLFDEKMNLLNTSSIDYINNFSSQSILLDAISKQIITVSKGTSIKSIGFACPGPLDIRLGKILNTPNLTLLQNCNFIDEMSKRLNLPCYLNNDANLFTLGEYKSYSGNKDVFIGITLGTGLGFGIVINGKLFTGAHGMAAEYGISPVEWGEWERELSIKGISKLSNKYFNKTLSPKKIFNLATDKDNTAQQIWSDFGEKLGLCISHVINMFDPNAISVGGGLSHAFNFFHNSMEQNIIKYSPAYVNYDINIFESTNKELSAKRGAALFSIN